MATHVETMKDHLQVFICCLVNSLSAGGIATVQRCLQKNLPIEAGR